MKTQPQITKQFEAALTRLLDAGLTVKSDGMYYVLDGEATVCETDSVDGLTGFLAGLDYAGAKQ